MATPPVLASIFPGAMLGLALAAALGLALGWMLQRRRHRVLSQLQQAVERYSAGELGFRVVSGASGAEGRLIHALHRMAEREEERTGDLLRRLSEHQAVLSSMTEGVLAVDSALRVLSLNPAAARMFGADAGQARGRSLVELVRHPDLLRLTQAALDSPEPVEGEIALSDADRRILQVHGTPLHDGRGQRIGVLVVLNDVTELRRLEGMRRDFVANVSHELKTPVTSIKGFVETLLAGAMEHRDEAERFLGIIARQAERLSAIIDDLLNLSRVERDAEAGDIGLEATLLQPVVQAALQSCELQSQAKAIRLESDCPPGLSARVNAPLLEQALVNLIDNAVKYSPAGGRVRVAAQAEPEEVRLAVQDWGQGIEAKHLPRLFERFYRVDKARSRKLGGTGLGLAIVKHIAQAHGGKVSVESVPGQGSTFFIHLPKVGGVERGNAREKRARRDISSDG